MTMETTMLVTGTWCSRVSVMDWERGILEVVQRSSWHTRRTSRPGGQKDAIYQLSRESFQYICLVRYIARCSAVYTNIAKCVYCSIWLHVSVYYRRSQKTWHCVAYWTFSYNVAEGLNPSGWLGVSSHCQTFIPWNTGCLLHIMCNCGLVQNAWQTS